jgi:hypothetical protein
VRHIVMFLRSRTRRLAVFASVVLGVLAITAVPASAHTLAIVGTTTCSDGAHVVTFTLSNDFSTTMTVTNATASINGTTYPIVADGTTVSPTSSITASVTIPGPVTGTVDATAHGTWPDGVNHTVTTTVPLVMDCSETTTTTSTTTTSTTEAPTTSTSGVSNTIAGVTTTTQSGGVSPTEAGATTTSAASGAAALPFTGSSSGPWAVAGLVALVLGAVLVLGAKRQHAIDHRAK